MAREKTKFTGVYQRKHSTRRHLGKADVCYDITFKDVNGKKIWQKVGWISEGYTAQVASRIRAEQMRTIRHGNIQVVSVRKQMSFSEAFVIYKKDWLYQVKTATEDERRFRAYLEPEIGSLKLQAITPLELERIKSNMTSKGYSPQTIRHALSLVRRIYRKLSAWGLYKGEIPTKNTPMPKVDAGRTRFLSQSEAGSLLTALKRRSSTWHDIAFISLHTGMRLGEVLELRWEDIDIENGFAHIRDAKSGSRTALLTPEVKELLQGRSPKTLGLIFPARGSDTTKASFKASKTFFSVVKELGFNDGISDRRQRVVFHTLRHTYASWLAIKGVPLYVIGELLGHKSIEMTKRYSHLCPDVKREAIAHISAITSAIHKSASDKS